MKKLLVILPLLALLSCTGVPSQTVLSHFDWTEPADPQGEQPETWNGVEKPLVTFGSTDIRYPRATPCADAVTDQTPSRAGAAKRSRPRLSSLLLKPSTA